MKETISINVKLFINANMSRFSINEFDCYSYLPKNTLHWLKVYFIKI